MRDTNDGKQAGRLDELVGRLLTGCTDYGDNQMADDARAAVYCGDVRAVVAEIDRLRPALLHARDALAEFHHTGDVPDVLENIDAALRPNTKLNGGEAVRCSD